MASITFEHVGKQFDTARAVDDFDLRIEDGEFVVLVGPSGCGKTTSLRMLAGLEQPTEGRIHLGGRDITDLPSKARSLAMVFQSYALYPHMSVAENISFALSLKRLPRAEIAERVQRAAAMLGIDHLLERKPRALSGGQRQRVAVARAIIRDPQAFLFDEPLSNLDAKLRHSARVEIRKLQQDLGTTTVYVTHDQVEAMTMADRIVVMEGGRIRQQGAPMELYRNPNSRFVASFLGSPPTNFIDGHCVHDAGTARFVGGALSVPLNARVPAGQVTLGLRPESLRLSQDAAGTIRLAGGVRFVEALGAETLVDLDSQGAQDGSAGHTITARLPGQHALAPGTRLDMGIAPADLMLFDAQGDAIPAAFAP
ncbi:ABC transporter ATP-binding protein [Pseudooceanicola aestuarii]|uniref:ABC transporter ATP-binding protein n=1 Tax=Pseudooceanicola aestuarii TaxID=2697319 RepID=UPI0013D7B1DD|nr:ABC transporter ATP-binding protein [Pseudooceanicola aestuarii]